MRKEIDKDTYVILTSAITALVGVIIYIITSVSGYLAGASMNPLPVICTVAALVLMSVLVFMGKKFSSGILDLSLILANVLILVSIYHFIMSRVSLAADVYFIPVNYPASEAAALHISIAGIVLYLIAEISMLITGFTKRSDEIKK